MNTKQRSRTLMVQGTTSDAGKSILVAAFCRCLSQRGKRVAPFKPQNMALNSAVTPQGGEIGRAQALQARAAGIEPHVDMNPILLKPSSDTGAQVIVHGKAISSMQAKAYHDYKRVAMDAVLSSHQRLTEQFDYVVVEGAGSPAEINLREGDVANMGFAEAVDCPVIIVADIDRGGVFAHLVGTLALLSQSEQDRVVGFVINRFRGDIGLLQPGIDWLEKRTQKPVLGVLPYLQNLRLDEEDALRSQQQLSEDVRLVVRVPVFSRISNHTDFEPLKVHPNIDFAFVPPEQSIPPCDLIILPGTKNVRGDLHLLRKYQWDNDIARHLRYRGKVLGICGGYQMLGVSVSDPDGIEGEPGTDSGLGYLNVETVLKPEKQLTRNSGCLLLGNSERHECTVSGYQIHAGQSRHTASDRAFALLDNGCRDGAVSTYNNVAGTYLHGIFDQSEALKSIMAWAGATIDVSNEQSDILEQELNRIADMLNEHLDWETLSLFEE